MSSELGYLACSLISGFNAGAATLNRDGVPSPPPKKKKKKIHSPLPISKLPPRTVLLIFLIVYPYPGDIDVGAVCRPSPTQDSRSLSRGTQGRQVQPEAPQIPPSAAAIRQPKLQE